jgi:gas vesicle protein
MFGRKNGFGKYALAFALGAVAGAAVALLYAPFPGKKMQKKVTDVTGKVLDVVEEQVENVQGFARKIAKS